MADPILHTLELAAPPTTITKFTDWFAGRHGPDWFRIGFDTVTSYRMDGDMPILDLYQAKTWDIFLSDKFNEMKGKDPYAAEAGEGTSKYSNTVYGYSSAGAAANPNPIASVDADWISFMRFAADSAQEEAVGELLAQDGLGGLTEMGARNVRLLSRSKDHPTLPSLRPRCAVLVEWNTAPPSTDVFVAPVRAMLGGVEINGSSGVRAWPWPDDRSLRG